MAAKVCIPSCGKLKPCSNPTRRAWCCHPLETLWEIRSAATVGSFALQWSGLDGCSIIAYLSFCNPQGLIKSNRLRCCSTLEMQYVSFCSAVFCGSVRHLYASDSTLIQRQHANARGGESTCDSITKIRRRQMQAGPLCDPV
jgi:hypothetical protein